jgi:hypothetical protein
MPITLLFNVPVHVEVDVEALSVLSVKVDDEHCEGPIQVLDDDSLDPVLIQRGAAIAERASWPSWEFGM